MPTPTRRPSSLGLAALVISVLSLLVGSGAVSYAAGLARGSVGTPQLRSGAVTAAKLHGNAVSTVKLKKDSVTAEKLQNGAVTTDKLTDGAVSTDELRNDAVSTDKLRNDAVTGAKVQNGSIDRSDLAAGLVPTPSVYRKQVMAIVAPVQRLASLNGLALDARCQSSGPSGTIAALDVGAASDTAPSFPLTATYLTVRRDAGSAAETTTTGASEPFTGVQLLAYAGTSGTGATTMTGVVQYLDQAPVRFDIGLSGVGGSSRSCRFTVLATPVY